MGKVHKKELDIKKLKSNEVNFEVTFEQNGQLFVICQMSIFLTVNITYSISSLNVSVNTFSDLTES